MNKTMKRAGWMLGGAAGAVSLGWLGYAATAWYRYGRVVENGTRDALLDRFMPAYEVRERHETRVAAPAADTYAAARAMDLYRSPLVHAIFRGRELLMRPEPTRERRPQPLVDEVLALGWGVLAEEPGREIVVGAVTQPWTGDVVFRALPPAEFASFNEPGYAKIVWTIAADPLGPAESTFRTETRVVTTDAYARERFRRYWAVFSPGILLIRRESLRLVKAEAEQQFRDSRIARAGTWLTRARLTGPRGRARP